MHSDFLYFEEFCGLIPELDYKRWIRLGREGKAPRGRRLTPSGRPRFNRDAVEVWLRERGIPLFETFDGEMIT